MEINLAAPKFQDVGIAWTRATEGFHHSSIQNMFYCMHGRDWHIEKKKSKCDYELASCPNKEQIQAIEEKVNEVIRLHLPVSIEFMSQQEAKDIVDLSKLPEDASETLRIVRIGGYDVCACIGLHVENTSEIGTFKIISYDYNEERKVLRMRFKLIK